MKNKEFIQNQFDIKNIAVLLVNFGGPHNLKSVKSFLYNLFSDPMVINFPFIRTPFAWLIANLRCSASKRMYKTIGSISPLIPITYLQADELQSIINKNNLSIDIFISFRYSKPYINTVLDEIKARGYKKIIILPLYPQYSYTTTGSVELIVNDWLRKNPIELFFIKNWHNDEDYIQSYVNLIDNSLKNLDLRSTEIIFSAHSIPLINVQKGDPYQKHIIETVQAIVNKLNWKKRWHIGYQSKIGFIRWLDPSTDRIIREIACRNKNANLLIVPISFICEHVETIFEIGYLYKKIACDLGIKRFVRVPALNTDKYLIQALYNQILNCLESNGVNIFKSFLATQ